MIAQPDGRKLGFPLVCHPGIQTAEAVMDESTPLEKETKAINAE